MQPTKRLTFIVGIGVILVLIGSLMYLHVPIFIFFNLGIFICVLIDLKISKVEYEITRDEEETLSLFAEEELVFTVYNKSENELDIQIKDRPIDFSFEVIDAYTQGIIEPHEKKKLSYRIMPKKRGIYTFDTVYVRYLSRLKLLKIYKTYEIPTEVKVYPNLKDVKKYRLMVYDGYVVRGGKRVYNRRGEGLEFESLREYISGDSYKKINWKATASMNKPIINQYEVEKNQDIISFIDSGKAMSYEVRGYKKLDLAINTALILSDIANVGGDKSGLMVFNTQVQQYVKPGTGKAHRNQLLESLYRIEYNRNVSNFFEAFKYLNSEHKKRSILFVFTEFETMDEAKEYLQVLPQVSRRHLVIMFMMTKEKVVELTENNSSNDSDLFIKGAALDVLQERREIINQLRKHKIMCIECLPETLTTEVVNQYIRLKNSNMI